MIVADTFGRAWRELLTVLLGSKVVRPRGKPCREMLGVQIRVSDATQNILVSEVRNPQYRFMVAEWLWIWFGHSDVATIARYNKHIAQFSDDGMSLHGAYGPRIMASWEDVQQKLMEDQDTRQAFIPIFSAGDLTAKTKDVPCTTGIQFLIRNGRLETIVGMRSSDVWLGLPYDFFVFSMLANTMAAQLNLSLGGLVMNLGSSHLYESDVAQARSVSAVSTLMSPVLIDHPPDHMDAILTGRERTRENDGWWTMYGRVLEATSNIRARIVLEGR